MYEPKISQRLIFRNVLRWLCHRLEAGVAARCSFFENVGGSPLLVLSKERLVDSITFHN